MSSSGFPIAQGAIYNIIKGDYKGLQGKFVGYDSGGPSVILKVEVLVKAGKEMRKEDKEVRVSPTSAVPDKNRNTLILHQQAKIRNTQNKATRNVPLEFRDGVEGKQVVFGQWLVTYDGVEYAVDLSSVRQIRP